MIFAVFDLPPLTLCINCIFYIYCYLDHPGVIPEKMAGKTKK